MSSVPFRVCEDYTDRFENVRISGLNYGYFTPANERKAPVTWNTRIYSCILIDNSVTHRWRGRYNEDTDLSLRVLKDGDCTILMNAFTCGKAATLTMKGGNTEEIYKIGNSAEFDNRYSFAKSLYDQHPDVVSIVMRYGRWHHSVDYSSFENNTPIIKPGIVIPKGNNEYGLRCVRVDENDVPIEYVNIGGE